MLEKEAKERGINVSALKKEQEKLAKQVSEKDAFDFKNATHFGAIITETMGKEILAVAVIINENFETIEKKFSIQKARFPYIPGYRAFRELPVMLDVYEKLQEQADVFFILGHGIAHPRGLGIASHFGVMINKPTIGIAKNLIIGEEQNNKIFHGKKIVAEKLQTKEGAKPIYVSVGNMISLDSAVELVKRLTRKPHKLPEPIVKARKFAKEIKKELRHKP
ncbi:MAG: endonuclease V [Candidatus Pacearchaeota archaeon]